METEKQSEVMSRTGYSDAIKAEALQQRMNGSTYCEIAQALNVPTDTLRKWFAPSINRHNLATLKEEQFEELTSASQRLLKANVVSVTEKLTEKALEGDMRAILAILDRVYGAPAKQQPNADTPYPPIALVEFIGSPSLPAETEKIPTPEIKQEVI